MAFSTFLKEFLIQTRIDTNGNEGETGNTGAGSVTTGDNNATTTEGGETGADGGKGETGGSTAATPVCSARPRRCALT